MHAFPRKVVCAANRITMKDGRVITLVGVRHWDPLMHEQADAHGIANRKERVSQRVSEEQGFLDQWRVFMDRKEAMQVVLASGQPFDMERNGGSGDELYSEGVW